VKDLMSSFAWLRAGSVKNLIISTESIIEILRLSPQNDITTQSLAGECNPPISPLPLRERVRVRGKMKKAFSGGRK